MRFIFAANHSFFVKKIHVAVIIFLILLADQALKFYIKTHYHAGQETMLFGHWGRLHFLENPGMAWGWKIGDGGNWGKIALTVFRMIAVVFGVFYIGKIVKRKDHPGFIFCVALIFAGAVGNLIDSMFYGIFFENSDEYIQNVAKFLPHGGGYTTFLHGKVVDMLYFPIIQTHYPSWVPWVGGTEFEFFSPVFNIADASISCGLIIILLFQKRFFGQHGKSERYPTVETSSPVNDEVQIS